MTEVLAEVECNNLQNSDYKSLENVQDLLEPFAKYTQLASAEDMSTISMVIPIILESNLHLDDMEAKAGLSCASQMLKDALNKIFKNIVKPSDKNGSSKNIYVAATLDLRYWDLLDDHYIKTAKTYLSSAAGLVSSLLEENCPVGWRNYWVQLGSCYTKARTWNPACGWYYW